jgi:hypothetical protein
MLKFAINWLGFLEIHHLFFHCKPTGVRNQQVGAEDGRKLDAMVDTQRNLVV